MKIEIDLEQCFGIDSFIELHSQAEYDALPCSASGALRESTALPGQRRTFGRVEEYRDAPTRFPCILIEGYVVYRSDSADMIPVTYIYDYKKLAPDRQCPNHEAVTTGED